MAIPFLGLTCLECGPQNCAIFVCLALPLVKLHSQVKNFPAAGLRALMHEEFLCWKVLDQATDPHFPAATPPAF